MADPDDEQQIGDASDGCGEPVGGEDDDEALVKLG